MKIFNNRWFKFGSSPDLDLDLTKTIEPSGSLSVSNEKLDQDLGEQVIKPLQKGIIQKASFGAG